MEDVEGADAGFIGVLVDEVVDGEGVGGPFVGESVG